MAYVIPDLSHLVDYEVKEARDTEDGFEIEFIDDTVLRSYRQDIPLPNLPEGFEWDKNLRLLRVIQSELDTRVQFAHKRNAYEVFSEITLDPNRYSLKGTRSQGEEIFPQRREDDQSLPPDPSSERVVEGPDAEWAPETPEEIEERQKMAEEIQKVADEQVQRQAAGYPDETKNADEEAKASLESTAPQPPESDSPGQEEPGEGDAAPEPDKA
jgi:hypothetical protein